VVQRGEENREEYWRERVAAQERSGRSVKQFCEQQQITEQSFYVWRKRLRNQPPMRFALVETGMARPQVPAESGLELVLTTGERLRIGAGFDPGILRQVLAALRA
jgi:transposase-like protein